MRLRRIPGAREKLLQYPQWLVLDPTEYKGRWREYFAEKTGQGSEQEKEVHLELGVGKGNFINTMAQSCPEKYWLGVELREEVLLQALAKAEDWEAPNLTLIWSNIERLAEFFVPGEVDRIYLNFSDPWPKARHSKRRLTYTKFLDIYKVILKKNSEIHLKTDNRGLFEFSLEEFQANGFKLREVTFDLHQEKEIEEFDLSARVMTEYEKKFSSQGQPIHRCVAQWT
ncbi:tRNA (guanosine(46)-N7)-methyltransferase TrmB [Heliorestis acidaminivorans]|uniref:tRNA (guanine-N(7)-)-methyltransferase n=1 Tax=Heliorestis acidaminivorans TaxID=553427 RepID=A0A6I0ES76_9FIRM|nr:tRNA (guanosine(46)-N7)-methyltransferase TrmB [Heliorestis acidaminivorans]KAB2953350.1 tRNA (guanosine(46)-N7)-methyltransferase TrmB [Heliorestis acidaminivorans]